MAGPRGANVGTQTTVGGKEARRGGGELIQHTTHHYMGETEGTLLQTKHWQDHVTIGEWPLKIICQLWAFQASSFNLLLSAKQTYILMLYMFVRLQHLT